MDLPKIDLDPSRVVVDDGGKTTLLLTTPVANGENELHELVFRRPVAADFAAMDEARGEQAAAQRLIAQVCDVPLKVVRQLDGYDYLQASAVIGNFLLKPRQTGAAS